MFRRRVAREEIGRCRAGLGDGVLPIGSRHVGQGRRRGRAGDRLAKIDDEFGIAKGQVPHRQRGRDRADLGIGELLGVADALHDIVPAPAGEIGGEQQAALCLGDAGCVEDGAGDTGAAGLQRLARHQRAILAHPGLKLIVRWRGNQLRGGGFVQSRLNGGGGSIGDRRESGGGQGIDTDGVLRKVGKPDGICRENGEPELARKLGLLRQAPGHGKGRKLAQRNAGFAIREGQVAILCVLFERIERDPLAVKQRREHADDPVIAGLRAGLRERDVDGGNRRRIEQCVCGCENLLVLAVNLDDEAGALFPGLLQRAGRIGNPVPAIGGGAAAAQQLALAHALRESADGKAARGRSIGAAYRAGSQGRAAGIRRRLKPQRIGKHGDEAVLIIIRAQRPDHDPAQPCGFDIIRLGGE